LKVVAIVQARMGSSRLPKKSLMPLSNSTLLEKVIDSVKKNEFIDEIVVATTHLDRDNLIEEKCKSIKVECFRGDENDVLSRFVHISKKYKPKDVTVRVTADNPINNLKATTELFEMHRLTNSDYTCVDGLSHIVYEFITVEALQRLEHNDALDNDDKEHVTKYIRENPLIFDVNKVDPKKLGLRPNLDKLLTADTKADFERLKDLYNSSTVDLNSFTSIYGYLESKYA